MCKRSVKVGLSGGMGILVLSGLLACGTPPQASVSPESSTQTAVAPTVSTTVQAPSRSSEQTGTVASSASQPKASASTSPRRPLLAVKEEIPLTYSQEIEASFQTLGIQGVGPTLAYLFYSQLSLKGFLENATKTQHTTASYEKLSQQVVDELKKGLLSTLTLQIKETEDALSRVKGLNPSAADQGNHQSYLSLLEKEQKYIQALSEIISESQLTLSNAVTANTMFHTQALERSSLSSSELVRSTDVKGFLKTHWKTAHENLLEPLKKIDSYNSQEHRTFYLDQSLDLHLLLKDIAAFFVKEPDASALMQKENLLLEKVQTIGRIQPPAEDVEAHYALYDWALASYQLVQQIKVYAEAHQDTEAVFNITTAAQDPALARAISYWLVCYFNVNGKSPEVYIPEN